MRNLTTFKTGNPNSMAEWWKVKNPLAVTFNFIIILICRYAPSLRLKRFLYRLIGMNVGRNAGVGLEVTFDIFFPELIEIGADSVIGHNVTVLAHEFLVGEWRKGRTVIGNRVMLGASSVVLAGVKIGDGATVSAMSLVNDNVPAGAFVGGIPAKRLKHGDGKSRV